jgi:hypothetical protein
MKKILISLGILAVFITGTIGLASELNTAYLPSVYNQQTKVPTLTPTPTKRPTKTPTPRPSTPVPTIPPDITPNPNYPYNWIVIGGIHEDEGIVEIPSLVASVCHEVHGRKEDKTIIVWDVYIGDVACEARIAWINENGNLPHEAVFPMPECVGDESQDFALYPCVCKSFDDAKKSIFCGELERLDYWANAQEVCTVFGQCISIK